MSELCEIEQLDELVRHLQVSDQRIPLGATVDLTYRCNFGCPHCFCRLPEHATPPQRELSADEWDRIFGECVDEGTLMVTLTGGEPLVRHDFREIWLSAKRRGLLVTLFTNGALITPELADFLAEWTPRRISMTVYGASEETYCRMTGREGMFERVLRSLDLLVERGIQFEVKALFSRLNAHEFQAIHKLASEYTPVLRWQAELLGSYREGGGDPEAVCLSPAEIIQLELADDRRADEWRTRIPGYYPAPPQGDRPFRCRIGLTVFHLDPYGYMQPCMLLEDMRYNLHEGSVKEGWREWVPQAIRNFKIEPGPCQVCELAMLCRLCPAKALLRGAPPSGPTPYYCALARGRARAFGIEDAVSAAERQ